MDNESVLLTNGLKLIVEGENFGDGLADTLPQFVSKYNQNLPLLLTVNDRSISNSDLPFTFEGSVYVNDGLKTTAIEVENLKVFSEIEVNDDIVGGKNLKINETLLVGGSGEIQGDLSLQGNLSANNLSIAGDFSINSLVSSNELGFIDLKGSRLVNSFQNPTRSFEIVNKQYVDQRLNGFRFFNSCRVHDAQDPLSDKNVIEQVDQEENFNGTLYKQGRLTIDGIDLDINDRVLITSYRSELAYRNGIYRVVDYGGENIDWILERDSDFQTAEIINQSDLVYINGGDNGNMIFHFIKETPFTSEAIFSRAVYFTPYRANVSIFTGEELGLDDRLSSLESRLLEEIQRLESSISRVQQTVLPKQIEIPVGTVFFHLGNHLETEDYTVLKLDGSQHQKAEYPELYEVINNWLPDLIINSVSFKVPDLSGRTLFASGSSLPLGEKGGTKSIKLRPSQLPDSSLTIYSQGHNHPTHVWRERNNGETPLAEVDDSAPLVSNNWESYISTTQGFDKISNSTSSSQEKISSSVLGSASPINIMPPYHVSSAYIKAKRSLVVSELPRIIWFSFDEDFILFDKSSSSSFVNVYIQLDLSGLSSEFLSSVKLEIINEKNNTVLFRDSGIDNSYQDKKVISLQPLSVDDHLLSLRITEPTVPNSVWSTSLNYRRQVTESPTSPTLSQADRTCRFKILSAFATPLEVSPSESITYRTQAEGVYHIQTTIYFFSSNQERADVIPGVVVGDIQDVSCRQLLLVGQWVAPASAIPGDTIAIEFRYWSPINPSQEAYKSETIYLDII